MKKGAGFPGFEKCVEMMRSRHALQSEEGFHWLVPHAAEYVPHLIAAYWDEENAGITLWLLELIGIAKSPDALPFLLELLHDDNSSIHYWVVRGLRQLNSKEARTALWQAGESTNASD